MHITNAFGERPFVSGEITGNVLTLAERVSGWVKIDRCARRLRSRVVLIDGCQPHQHTRGGATPAMVAILGGDDDGATSKLELGAMVAYA